MEINTFGPNVVSPFNDAAMVPFQKERKEIDGCLTLADTMTGAGMMANRKEAYEHAFSVLCHAKDKDGNCPKELRPKLYELLLKYGSNVRYNQGADGFRDCARLMRLSLLLQCVDLELLKGDYPWQHASSLQQLMSGLPDLQNE